MKMKRLPPGQREIKKSPLRHIGSVPEFDPKTWNLVVYGEIEKSFSLSWNDILKLLSITSTSDFHCVEGWSALNNEWEGISFQTIVGMVKPKENAKYVTFECDDGYTTSLPVRDLLERGVLLAYKLQGEQLKPERGGPLRLIVPHKYAYKSAMWVRKIRCTSTQELGYWESRGYSNTADPWKEDRRAK
mgnify:CR=1 FL=1